MRRAMTVVSCLLSISCAGERAEAPAAAGEALPGSPSTGWTIEETMRIRRVDHVRLSSDGRQVLFAVRSASLEGDKGEYRTRIHVANTDGTGERALTPADYSATGAEWSPDDRWIAFVADRSGTAAGSTIWVVPSGGGAPRPIEVGGTGAANLRWSPDGSRLAFTMPAPATDAQRAAAEHPDAPQVVDAEIRKAQLWVIGMSNGAANTPARALSSDSVSVHTETDLGAPYDWSPDGSVVVFAYNREGNWRDNWQSTGITIVNVATGELTSPVRGAGMAPRFGPDGRLIAYLSNTHPTTTGGLDVYVASVEGAESHRLALTHDRWPTLVGWSADGRRVYVAEARKTLTSLTALSADGRDAMDVDPGDAVLGAWSLHRSAETVAFTRQTLTTPTEVYVSRLDQWRPVQVSQANAALPRHPLPRTELVRWQSSAGAEVEGLLAYPMNYTSGQRYPLIVAVRSGGVSFKQSFIASPFQEAFEDYYPVLALAREGYAVLLCNSRGGALPGYGPDYALPFARPAEKAFADVMSGVDHLVALGLADSSRLGITGMSNGGLTTSWVITQTRRFKAAIVQSGMTELISGATTGPRFSRDLGAEPWEDVAPFLKHSPLLHLGSVTTPTLVLRGGSDDRVPWNQAYGLYRALQRRGVATEMVVYPGEGHPVRAPKHLVDIGRRHVEWMGRYLR